MAQQTIGNQNIIPSNCAPTNDVQKCKTMCGNLTTHHIYKKKIKKIKARTLRILLFLVSNSLWLRLSPLITLSGGSITATRGLRQHMVLPIREHSHNTLSCLISKSQSSLFTARCCHSLLWPKATAFYNSKIR